ncbi:hypothetical protein [Solicola sp. PLA-1-18]|uniref:hypothetical protein n=1 Tax=Solicola sp. PLA-1-18 TaxID=3380532 RepID=UPI003B778F59
MTISGTTRRGNERTLQARLGAVLLAVVGAIALSLCALLFYTAPGDLLGLAAGILAVAALAAAAARDHGAGTVSGAAVVARVLSALATAYGCSVAVSLIAGGGVLAASTAAGVVLSGWILYWLNSGFKTADAARPA